MTVVRTIGLDIANHAFRAHRADASGFFVFRGKILRAKVTAFSRHSRAAWWHWRLAAGTCLDGARWSRVIFDFAQVVGAVMSRPFCAENRVRRP
jgi:hypothetical protein